MIPEMEVSKKRIAIFLDGTWNVVSNNTNVWRLKSLCQNNQLQVVYYSQGVGTEHGTGLTGGMFGAGLDQEVINAYEWLIEQYNPGDELFIFGFSRGAYTARSLSGFISKCGILQRGAPLGVGELFDRYKKDSFPRTIRELTTARKKNPAEQLNTQEEWMLTYSFPAPVKFIGVWDTVGALGIPVTHLPIISRSDYHYLEIDLRIDNYVAYHALAIDENRNAFRPSLWTREISKSAKPEELYPPLRTVEAVEQRWFVGAHANVGGGYDSDLLAQIPLKWLMGKAIEHGLQFRGELKIDGDASIAPQNDSYADFLHGVDSIFESRYYRPIGKTPVDLDAENQTITINETIDSSVFERWRKDPSYRPANLVDWAKAHGVDVASFQQTIRADKPSEVIPDSPAAAQ